MLVRCDRCLNVHVISQRYATTPSRLLLRRTTSKQHEQFTVRLRRVFCTVEAFASGAAELVLSASFKNNKELKMLAFVSTSTGPVRTA